MNATITENIREAITLISAKEWMLFFNEARQAEYATLVGTPDSELTKVKNRVMIIDELEHLFKTARHQPVTSTEQ